MHRVTKEEFFAAVGPLDSMPRVDVASFKNRVHVSQWEIQHTRQILGRSESDSWRINPTEFYLAPGFRPAKREG